MPTNMSASSTPAAQGELADWEKELLGLTTPKAEEVKGSKKRRRHSRKYYFTLKESVGRCNERALTSNGRHQSWGANDYGVLNPSTGELTKIQSWKDLKALREQFAAQGLSYDGSVIFAPKGQLAQAIEAGTFNSEYMDPSTIRGGYPEDCPQHVRDAIGAFVAEFKVNLFGNTQEMRDIRATLAIEMRALGYPQVSLSEMLKIAAQHYPGLEAFKVKDSHITYQPPLGLFLQPRDADLLTKARVPAASDRKALLEALRRSNVKIDGKEIEKALDRLPTLVAWDSRGKLTVVKVSMPEDESYAKTVYSNEEGWFCSTVVDKAMLVYATSWLSKKDKNEPGLCYKCLGTPCECFSGKEDFIKYVKETLSEGRGDHSEHRWGTKCSSRLTFDNHRKAVERAAEVKEYIDGKGSTSADKFKEAYGENVFYNLALFLEQTGQPTEVLDSIGDALFKELAATRKRVKEMHGRYADTLFNEFEHASKRTVHEKLSEVYLGRDGIYAYNARQAQLNAIRKSMGPDERRRRRQEEDELHYVIASRSAEWVPEMHESLLGSARTMFIDTGFSGTIPRKIARAQASAGRGEKVGMKDRGPWSEPDDIMRLFSTDYPRYGFQQLMSHNDATIIEHDAKTTFSSGVINGGRPTPALEQLVFRQARDQIRAQAYERTLALTQEAQSPEPVRSGPLTPPGPVPLPPVPSVFEKIAFPAPPPFPFAHSNSTQSFESAPMAPSPSGKLES